MKIKKFDTEIHPLIVAEIGNNHEGRFDVAEKLVRAVAESGAPALKFQTFQTENFVSPANEKRFNQLKSFELSFDEFKKLSDLAKSLDLLVVATPLDMNSAEFLNSIVDAFKIASSDNTFYPLIQKVLSFGKPVIVSTGLATSDEIKAIGDFIGDEKKKAGLKNDVAFLHCVSAYPVPPKEANLLSIPYLRKTIPYEIGYSDHTEGLEAALGAVALGARIIEKHFTLDKNFSDFRDHKLSADPSEMKELVTKTKTLFTLLGQENKVRQPSEEAHRTAIRRAIAVNKDKSKGSTLKMEDLTWLRPQEGLAPGEENKVIGKKTTKDLKKSAFIREEDVS